MPRAATTSRADSVRDPVPYLMRLPDGRHLFVEVPPAYTRRDRDGEIGFTISGVKYLDRIRALALRAEKRLSPGHLVALRDALGMTQEAMGRKLGVAKMTISRWENGQLRPGRASLAAIRQLRSRAARRGMILEH